MFIPTTDKSYNTFLIAYEAIRKLEAEFADTFSKGVSHYNDLAKECEMIFGERPLIEKVQYQNPKDLLAALHRSDKVKRKMLGIDGRSREVRIFQTDTWMLTQQSKLVSEEGFAFIKNDFSLWPEYTFSCQDGSTCYIFGDIKEFEEDAMLAILKTENNS